MLLKAIDNIVTLKLLVKTVLCFEGVFMSTNVFHNVHNLTIFLTITELLTLNFTGICEQFITEMHLQLILLVTLITECFVINEVD